MSEDLTQWEKSLCATIRARQPGVIIQSLEEERVLKSVMRVLQWMSLKKLGTRKLNIWSSVSFRNINILKTSEEKQNDRQELYSTLANFRDSEEKDTPRLEVLVLADITSELENANIVRALRETLWAIRSTQRFLIIMGKPFDVPDELAADLTIMPFDLPNAQDIQAVIEPVIAVYKTTPAYSNVNIEEACLPPFCRACAGLTEAEARGLFSLSVAQFTAFDNRAVDLALREKANVVRRSNILDYEISVGSLDEIGGLENVKQWIRDQDVVFKQVEAAKKYGLQPATGLLLAGLSGVGKSMTAKMLAAHWKLPLLRVDLGRVFGSLVGQSEASLRHVFAVIKAVSPAVVFFDEFEKAIGAGPTELDGGTSSRIRGALLTWMAEKPEGVFTVMTVNDIMRFSNSPEVLGSHRIDKIFFVDLPDFRARLEIMGIHLRKAGHHVPADSLIAAAKRTRGYTGAELRVIVQTALRYAFSSNPRLLHPTSEMFVTAAEAHSPLSNTMREAIKSLRDWAKSGRATPAGATLEDDSERSDLQMYHEKGLPDLLS